MLEETSSVETEKINSTNSSGEFDLDQFKYGTSISMKHGKGQIAAGIKQLEQDDIAVNYQGSPELDNKEEQSFIYYLGIKFPLEAIKERNFLPKHVFIPTYFCFFSGFGGLLIIFIFGTKYDLVSSILCVLVIVLGFFVITLLLKKSIKNGLKLKKNKLFIALLFVASNLFTCLILYAFLKKLPFDSVAYFLLAFYLSTLFQTVGLSFVILFNTDDFNDPNYQYKYYYKRIIMGILNATAIVDVLSDIALGVQIFQNYNDYLKYLGLFLFIFCSMDLFIVNVRVWSPSKVGIRMHISAIILEIFIIIISILAALKMTKNQLGVEFIGLLVVSFFTTGVNFLHHIFAVVEWYLENRERNKIIALGEIFW